MILNYTAVLIKHTFITPAETVCGGCLHHRPVTWEHLTPERQPIFCTCDFVPFYHFINHNVTHRNCEYYEQIN